jgi:hypothetical protein
MQSQVFNCCEGAKFLCQIFSVNQHGHQNLVAGSATSERFSIELYQIDSGIKLAVKEEG